MTVSPCRRFRYALGLIAASVLFLGGCSGASSHRAQQASRQQASQSRVPVSAGRSSALRLADGLAVQVPKGAVRGTGVLSGAIVPAPAAAPAGMALAGPVYRLNVAGTRLAGQVRLTVPVPAGSGPNAALLVFYNGVTRRWQPVPAHYDAASRTLTATTPHLSLWSVLRIDANAVLSAAGSLLKGFLGIADTTAQPSCPGQTGLAAAGVSVVSDKGNLVKWCAGVNGAQPLLRVADNRHYAMETDYPASWQVQRLGEPGSLEDQIVTDVTQFLSPSAAGGSSVIIPGGDTVQFTLPPGASGEAQTRPSGEGYLIDALLYAVDTLGMTMEDVPGAPREDPSKSARAVDLALQSKDCLTQADTLAATDVGTAHGAGELFRADVEFAVGCLGDHWQEAYGLNGFIGSFIVSTALWLASGIRLVVDGLHELIDNVVYWRTYRIAIGSSGPDLAAFRGLWYVHDGSLCVGQTLNLTAGASMPSCQGSGDSGWMRGWFGCNVIPPATVRVCDEWDELTFTSGPDGSIIGTITNVFYTTVGNAVIPGFSPGAGYDRPGDTFRLTHVAPGLLTTTYLHTHLSQSDLTYGNPYWCGPGISAANQPKCGA
jgi:hypothetical protein